MTQHDMTGWLLRYWPILLACIQLVLGGIAGYLLGQIKQRQRSYDRGWSAGYRAYAQQRREIADRIRQTRAAAERVDATRVLPRINPPRRPADQTTLLNLRRNP